MSDEDDMLTFVSNNIFNGRNFKPFPLELKAQICGPNQLYVAVRPEGKIGVLVAYQGASDRDWAVSKGGLHHLMDALLHKRIVAGAVVLTSDFKTVTAVAMVAEVLANLNDELPRVGPHGEYYWVTRAFQVAQSVRASSAYTAGPDEVF
jgi:hypothetical protein